PLFCQAIGLRKFRGLFDRLRLTTTQDGAKSTQHGQRASTDHDVRPDAQINLLSRHLEEVGERCAYLVGLAGGCTLLDREVDVAVARRGGRGVGSCDRDGSSD